MRYFSVNLNPFFHFARGSQLVSGHGKPVESFLALFFLVFFLDSIQGESASPPKTNMGDMGMEFGNSNEQFARSYDSESGAARSPARARIHKTVKTVTKLHRGPRGRSLE